MGRCGQDESVQKQKCPTGHYHQINPSPDPVGSFESKNKNARQGITT